MKRNIGELDQLLRTILGVYGMLLGFLFIQGVPGAVLGTLSLIVLITGLTGHCAIYTALHISTVEREQPSDTSAPEHKTAQEA